MRFSYVIASACLLTAGCAGDLPGGLDFGEELEDADVPADEPDARKRDTGSSATPTEDTSSAPSDDDAASPPIADTSTSSPDTAPVPKDTSPPVDMGPPPVAGCSVTLPSATGKEPGGAIPVCCTPSAADRAANMEVFAMVNEHRKANGKSELVYDLALESAIQGHCEHMKTHTFFDHSAPESAISSFTTRASKCGAKAGGENIAWGQTSPKEVMSSWKSSSGHNSNMLSGSWKRMGVGKSGTYWGQIFAP